MKKTYAFWLKDDTKILEWLWSIIDEHNHHPDIHIGYDTMVIESVTHDADNQVTEKDENLMNAIWSYLSENGIGEIGQTKKKPQLRINLRAIVWDKDRRSILFVRHARNAPWVIPGGHHEWNETFEAWVRRELREELGIEVEFLSDKWLLDCPGARSQYAPLDIIDSQYVHRDWFPVHKHVFVYETQMLKEVDSLITTQEEIYEKKWMTPDEFLALDHEFEIMTYVVKKVKNT